MAYPRKLLAKDEHPELELHPHWKALVGPVIALLVVVPSASFTAARVPDGGAQAALRAAIAALAVLLLAALTLLPFLRWLTTHYVVTDRRLITRRGIIARTGRDMPLTRVNDISFSHSVFERLLGCGTLVVESAGERGQLVLSAVPRVEAVQRRIYELADARARDPYGDDRDRHDRDYDEDESYDGRRDD